MVNSENRIAILMKTIKALEWSKLSYSGPYQQSVFCCPMCGGIRPEEYVRRCLDKDKRYLNGHSRGCVYNLIYENLRDYTLPEE